MKSTPELIERAYNSATISDIRAAGPLLEYCKAHDCSETDTLAIGIRYGVYAASCFGNKSAKEAYKLLHEYLGREDKKRLPAERIRKAVTWIRDPAELRELAAFMEDRAAALEVGIGEDPGSPDNDVNSDGNVEVE